VNSQYKRAADRVRSLITEGTAVAGLEQHSSVGPYIQEKIPLHAWWVKVENLIESVFGPQSAHGRQLRRLTKRTPEHSYEVLGIVGMLTGALDDLESGFLIGQENLVAGVVLDDVLEQALELVRAGFKDPAAVLVRVVVEDTLRRLSRAHSLDDTVKASALNDALWKKGGYGKPQWRLVQAWLDIGNAAAHGDFAAYTADQVRQVILDVERFLAQELGARAPDGGAAEQADEGDGA
jgi:hypothetical protein